MKRHLLSFNTVAVDEVLLRVLDSFSFLLEEHRQWRVKEWQYINNLYISVLLLATVDVLSMFDW